MAKRGRKSKYLTHVKPYLHDIQQWCNTLTEEQICKRLGVGKTAWNDYKREYAELADALKNGRQDLVTELKGVLIKRAKGFQYQETKKIEDSEGYVRTETVTKSALPDVAALHLLLKNYDHDNWSNNPQELEIRKREIELREKQAEANDW